MGFDINILLMKKAIELKRQIVIIPRRSHTIKGIPINFEEDILRIWVNTGKNIESVLFSEIGHFSFDVELWNMIEQNKIEVKDTKIKRVKIDSKVKLENETVEEYFKRTGQTEKEVK